MNYYTLFHHMAQLLPTDCIIVSEGANTMDIGRTMLPNSLPRHRQVLLLKDEAEGSTHTQYINIERGLP